MDDSVFAEVDIEPVGKPVQISAKRPTWAKAATQHRQPELTGQMSPPQTAHLPQPIAPRTPDPVREKFYSMRSLASKRPFPKSDGELFYRQARFMEDFADDFEGDAKFNMYFPCYHQMGYDYLRTYFTWRTRVRGGEIRETSLSYIFLYIYELLSGIGTDSPIDGLSKLMDIWGAFSNKHTAIERYLPKWLKDYHIFYELSHSFSEFVERHSLQKHYSLTLLFDAKTQGQLELWNTLSGYDVTKSKFVGDGNEELFAKCFDAVLGAIDAFCEEKGARFEDMLVYSVSRRSPWQPFKNALFGSEAAQTDREVHISKYERYFCKNGQWTANLPIYYSSQKDFIGYIIKKTEACLRNAVGYKYKLVAEMKPGSKPFRELQRPAAKRAELDRVIDKAVAEYYRDINRVVVTVDHHSLSRIREEALETQEQLIVEDEARLLPEPSPPAEESQTLSFSDGWKALSESLADIEREALSLIYNGGDIKAYALEKNIMLEVLCDGINEKASDCIGDSIMELTDEVYIFDEYRENVAQIV